MPIELMIQKSGISAYIRLKKQLATPFQNQGKIATPHLQYWENLIYDYNIKTPITDSCSGNEAADKAAKKGAENIGNKFQLIRTPVPQAIRKEDIDKAIRKEWKRKWQAAPQYKHTKHFYSGSDKNKAKKY